MTTIQKKNIFIYLFTQFYFPNESKTESANRILPLKLAENFPHLFQTALKYREKRINTVNNINSDRSGDEHIKHA